MGILNLSDNLPEQGKIKIGGKGQKRKTKDGKREYQLPVKWNYFQVTKLDRDETGNFTVDHELTAKLCKEGDPEISHGSASRWRGCVYRVNSFRRSYTWELAQGKCFLRENCLCGVYTPFIPPRPWPLQKGPFGP